MKFTFWDIVIVDNINIWVIVKSWTNLTYEVYVRMYNWIKTYKEDEIQRYLVRHKYLSDEELEYQNNAINN